MGGYTFNIDGNNNNDSIIIQSASANIVTNTNDFSLSNLLLSNDDASFNNVDIQGLLTTEYIVGTVFSLQPTPNIEDLSYINGTSLNNNIINIFTLPDKYYYPDYTPRSKVSISHQIRDILNSIYNVSHFINQPIDDNNTIRLHSLTPLETHTRTNPLNRPFNYLDISAIQLPTNQIFTLIARYSDNSYSDVSGFENPNPDISFACLCNIDSSNQPISPSWGPRILNQGGFGDCYAFSTAEMISFAYTKLVAEKLNIDMDNSSVYLKGVSDYYLPSMIYIEKTFNKIYSYFKDMNPFSQEGVPSACTVSYLSQDSCPLEFQYTYPLLLTSRDGDKISTNGNTYLYNEFIDKVINDTPNDILNSSRIMQNYKTLSITDTSYINLDFRLINIYNQDDTAESFKDKIKDLINNKYTVGAGIVCLGDISGYFCNPTDGYFYQNMSPYSDLSNVGGHAIVIVGYDDNKTITMEYTDICGIPQSHTFIGFFIIQNSWGTERGINNSGYFYLAYEHISYLKDKHPDHLGYYFGLKFFEKE